MDTSHHLLLLLMFLHYAVGSNSSCVKILPDSSSIIPLEVGKEFTATCHLVKRSEDYTSDDIEWDLENISTAKQSFRKLNKTSFSVTINVTSDVNGWLRCRATKKSLSYVSPCMYGILLHAGYPPLKPDKLSCIAVQQNKDISPYLNCSWDPGSRKPLIDTTYTVYVYIPILNLTYKTACYKQFPRSCAIDLETFPIHTALIVWVEVKNALGSERSIELHSESNLFAKPNPPLNVKVLTEANLPKCLMVTWEHPLHKTILKLSYAIRYRKAASDVWIEVPENFTRKYVKSFRLQSLEPCTQYEVQMRCIGEDHSSYWSDWSTSVTATTAEANPPLKPDKLSCIAVQQNKDISPYLNCSWDPGSRKPLIDTTYTVYVYIPILNLTYKTACYKQFPRSCAIDLETFPIHTALIVWVEVKNALGSERSIELHSESNLFAKPNPPLNVKVLTEANLPKCLMVTWEHPIHKTILKLSYAIRYRKAASDVWIEVPENFTRKYVKSFRLQSLEPCTQYEVQMRCIGEDHSSYWSDWSTSVTATTAEANPPLKPDKLSCIAVQQNKDISPYLNCSWDPGSRKPLIDTTYTVHVHIPILNLTYKTACYKQFPRSCAINLETFPIHTALIVWVEVKNALGSERSIELHSESNLFAKPNPPLNVKVLTEANLPKCLMVTWEHPIHKTILKLSYAIRYRKAASDVWIEVPENFTRKYVKSFRLQSLEPCTQYEVQMRCIGEDHSSYWSDWSTSVTATTAEAISLPPDQVSQGVKKSKSSLGAGLAVLPPPFAPKLHRAGIPQSQSLGSFPTPLTGEPLRNIQVLPAIPPQRKRSPSPLTSQNLSDNRN